MTTTHPIRSLQHPVLPWEITDTIIDFLHHDVRTLGACGAVCSEWLARSRYHIFSTIQLWPWRVRQFVRLAADRRCTFTDLITRIEVDDSRARLARRHTDGRSRSTSPLGRRAGIDDERETEPHVMFADAMAHTSSLPCFARVAAVQIRNVDWTQLRPTQRRALRAQLSRFKLLRRLEFHDVVFQDLREVERIVSLFPEIYHLTANMSFAQYPEHTLAAMPCTVLPASVESMELGTDDGIPILLSCISSAAKSHRVRSLDLKNIQKNHLQHIHDTLHGGTHLQTLSLHFKHEKVSPAVSEDDLETALDFSTLKDLHTLSISGMALSASSPTRLVGHTLPKILRSVEAPFLRSMELQFHIDDGAAADSIDWGNLESTLLGLHFFGMSSVWVQLQVGAESALEEADVERGVRAGMPDLAARGVLQVCVGRTRRAVEIDLVCDGDDEDK